MNLSIIMPVFNAESFLAKSVQSVLEQTYKEFELILVDDGSKDKSANLCDEFARSDSRVVVIHQENKGIGGARNAGLKVARGHYIGFIDNDDLIHPQMFEILISIAQKENAEIVMFPPYAAPANWQIPNIRYSLKELHYHEVLQEDLYANMFSESNNDTPYVTIWNKLWKKDILEEDIFPMYGSEDTVFNCKAYSNVSKAIWIDIQPGLYYWVQRDDSTCRRSFSLYHCMCLQSYFDMEEYIYRRFPQYHFMVAEKTFRRILSVRANARGTEMQKKVDQIICDNFFQFSNRMKSEYRLSSARKFVYYFFFSVPAAYDLFRNLNEYIGQIRKIKK